MVEEPAGVAPPETFVGRVGVERGVGMEVVVAVAAGPLDWVALHRQAAAVRQGIFQPLGCLEAPVTQLSVVG